MITAQANTTWCGIIAHCACATQILQTTHLDGGRTTISRHRRWRLCFHQKHPVTKPAALPELLLTDRF